MNDRLAKIRKVLQNLNLDAIIINKPESRYYLSGFSGSSGMLLISASAAKLITDFRYIEQAENQSKGYQIVRQGNDLWSTLKQELSLIAAKNIGFESDFVTFDTYKAMSQALPVTLTPVELNELRIVKDSSEIELIRKAVDIADEAFTHILSFLRPGISEISVAAELEHFMRAAGSEKPAFDTIVASGIRGALPHGIASDKLLEVGDFVTMDFGAVYKGYHSDITRTVCIGKASPKQREIYDIVLKAQIHGLQAVKAGIVGKDIDNVSREIISNAGYGEFFGHGLGHGVGLAIHEEPRLSPSNIKVALSENMIVTVEPGIYLPNWGGVRIEDTVVVLEECCHVLTASPKQMLEII